MNGLPEGFEQFSVSSGICRWSGVLRSGKLPAEVAADSFVGLCRRLQDGQPDEILKAGSKIISAKVDGWFVKMYKLPGISAQLRRRFRTGRAMHCLLAAEAVEHAGIPTPQVAAAIQCRSGFHICDFLITESFKDSDVTFRFLPEQEDFSRDCMFDDILPLVAKLHEAGIRHGDLNLRNIYCAGTVHDNGIIAAVDRETVGVIDLDGAEWFDAPLTQAMREEELARLYSGYCKVCRMEESFELVKLLVDRYEKLCFVKCSAEKIFRQVLYLLNRKR